ncbi:MAG: hypothetical protein FWF53_09660 [Candidatus Azobacteroides sp.]|nr:hypothetical protein [Candidatus Azobacteroides sp.]
MAKFAFTVPPLDGHDNPIKRQKDTSFIQESRRRESGGIIIGKFNKQPIR